MLKRNQRQELLLEQKPHFFHLQIQEISTLIWTMESPSFFFFFFLLVPVSVSKGGRISRFLHRSGKSICLAVTEGFRRHPPMRGGMCPFLADWLVCLWRLHCCLGEEGEGKTSFSLLCRAARIGSREVWTPEALKELLPCPALWRGPFAPDPGHGGHAGGTPSPAAITWSSPLQDSSEISS